MMNIVKMFRIVFDKLTV